MADFLLFFSVCDCQPILTFPSNKQIITKEISFSLWFAFWNLFLCQVNKYSEEKTTIGNSERNLYCYLFYAVLLNSYAHTCSFYASVLSFSLYWLLFWWVSEAITALPFRSKRTGFVCDCARHTVHCANNVWTALKFNVGNSRKPAKKLHTNFANHLTGMAFWRIVAAVNRRE